MRRIPARHLPRSGRPAACLGCVLINIDGMGRRKLRTAVYRDRIAGNPARIIRDKEGDDRGNVIGLADGDGDALV